MNIEWWIMNNFVSLYGRLWSLRPCLVSRLGCHIVHWQPFVPLRLCIDSHLCRCVVQRLCVAVFVHPCTTALCGCLYASMHSNTKCGWLYASMHSDFVRPLQASVLCRWRLFKLGWCEARDSVAFTRIFIAELFVATGGASSSPTKRRV